MTVRRTWLWVLLGVLALAGIFILRQPRKSEEVVASQGRSIFHVPTCKWAREINSNHRWNFSTPAKALSAGLRPCKICRHLMVNLATPDESERTPEEVEAWYREYPD